MTKLTLAGVVISVAGMAFASFGVPDMPLFLLFLLLTIGNLTMYVLFSLREK